MKRKIGPFVFAKTCKEQNQNQSCFTPFRFRANNFFQVQSAYCAGSSGPVHNVVLIDVCLDLETPGGRDFG
jgi:hypothetical protein